jgi:3'-phosphoadenosine 5'-phosphosulfate (PAPS) 3'-phosphatase
MRWHWRRFWLVDPLDGTKEFIQRNGEFTVNIALVEEGRSAFGVVHAPALNVTYFGVSLRYNKSDMHNPDFIVAGGRSFKWETYFSGEVAAGQS